MERLRKKVEDFLNDPNENGQEIVSIGYGFNVWYVPTAFITLIVDDYHV